MYIYSTTNKITNKKYIGKCVRVPEKSQYYIGSGTYLKSAIESYGKENFIKEIIETGISDKESLNIREQYWIQTLDTKSPNGYNLTDGGDGCQGMTQETKEKIRQKNRLNVGEKCARYGKKNSENHNRILREANLGRVQSEATKEKIGQSLKGMKRSRESIIKQVESRKRNKKPYTDERIENLKNKQPHALKVSQYTKDGVFVAHYRSSKEAYRVTGINNATISKCCKGLLKSAGKFIWKFTNEENNGI
jgi:group I intron endonuclease